MPRSPATNRCHDGLSFGSSQFKEVANFGPGIAPLFPVTHPYPTAEPFVYTWDRSIILRYPVIVHPAAYVLLVLTKPMLTGLTYRGLSPHKFTPMPGVHNCVHKTKTARGSFIICLSHNVLVLSYVSLPVIRARVRLVTHRVRVHRDSHKF